MRDWTFKLDANQKLFQDYLSVIADGHCANLATRDEFKRTVLAALPKSASLYIERLLMQSFDLHRHHLGFNRLQGTLYYPRLLAMPLMRKHQIAHCHSEASELLPMTRPLGLKIIALTRDLFDVIVSRRDMLAFDKRARQLSPAAVDRFLAGDDEYQIDVILDLFATRYLAFIASWWAERDSPDVCHIRFEDMYAGEAALVRRIADFIGRPFKPEAYAKAAQQKGQVNFHKGVPGRGEALNARQRRRIFDMAERFALPVEAYLAKIPAEFDTVTSA